MFLKEEAIKVLREIFTRNAEERERLLTELTPPTIRRGSAERRKLLAELAAAEDRIVRAALVLTLAPGMAELAAKVGDVENAVTLTGSTLQAAIQESSP